MEHSRHSVEILKDLEGDQQSHNHVRQHQVPQVHHEGGGGADVQWDPYRYAIERNTERKNYTI